MRFWIHIFILLGALSCGNPANAASLKVGPAHFIVHNVEPGRLYNIFEETGLRLTIFNEDPVARTWSLRVSRPSERGTWEAGYGEIPEPAWCRFNNDTVTVPAGGKAYATLTLAVPNEERYYNQHWVATLTVGGQAEHGGIGLEVDIRMQIETKSHPDVSATPAGDLGIKPSILGFDHVRPGEGRNGQVILYNNTGEKHTYTLRSLLEDGSLDRSRYLTYPYRAMPDGTWASWTREVTIAAGASAAVPVQVLLPARLDARGQRWENIVLVEPDKGSMGFFRIQVNCPGKKD